MADSKSAAAVKSYEAVVIGGGVAGLSGAMAIARGCRKVLVLEHHTYRNAAAEHLHNLVAHDGQNPSEFRNQCKESLKKYPSVHFMDGTVVKVERTSADNQPLLFTVHLKDGTSVQTRRIVLATGMVDEIPADIKPLWGKEVIHCPFCHGYEVKDRDWIVYMNFPMVVPYTAMCAQYVGSHQLTLVTDGAPTFSAEHAKILTANGVKIIEDKVAGVRKVGDKVEVSFADNKHAPVTAGVVLYKPHSHHQEIVTQLGCNLKPDGTIAVDMFGKTSVAGVFAGGDCMDFKQQLSVAIGNGAVAGVGCVSDLGMEDFTIRAAHAK